MRATALLISVLLCTLCFIQVPAETTRMPLNEVRAGMRGIGITVFQGSEREEFEVEILGVLQNGPKRSLIICELTGGQLAETGVIQGMSGSPVYVNDKLIGAVSYSLGSFATKAIAGLTPIEEMIATDQSAITMLTRKSITGLPIPITAATIATTMRAAFGVPEPFVRQANKLRSLGLPLADAGRMGVQLRPIATPLVLTGFTEELHNLWSTASRLTGGITMVGGTISPEAQEDFSEEHLKPGDAIGVSLIRGDLTMAGTGTVTMVKNDRVYAFGHPFYNLGPSKFPMTRAHITTVLPSMALSSKIAAIGDVLGTIDQDRPTGIYGSFGDGPKLIPIKVSLVSHNQGVNETFNFEVIDDQIFTPLLTYTSILNTFQQWTRSIGPRSYVVNATTRLTEHPPITFGNMYSGNIAASAASDAISAPLTAILENRFKPVQIKDVEVEVILAEETRTATLERIWLDSSRIIAGRVFPLRILSRNFRGEELLHTLMIKFPKHSNGQVNIQVSDAAFLNANEMQEGRATRRITSLHQLIRNLNQTRRNDRIYVRLVRSDTGAIDQGEQMPALPDSVLAVLNGNSGGDKLTTLRSAILGEWEIATDSLISGSHTLSVDVE